MFKYLIPLIVFAVTASAGIYNPAPRTDPDALPKAGGTMSGTLNMGGNSITNIGTNSLTFMDGTKVSVLSNGVLGVSLGGTNSPKTMVDSGNIATYAPTPPTYYADGPTLLKSGTTFSVQPWITDNLIALRYETWNHWASQTMGLLDGPGYWFSDQGGLLAAYSTNYTWANPGYQNSASVAGEADETFVSHWLMNDNAGSTVVLDNIGSTHNGVAVSNTSIMTVSGKINGALAFNGSSGFVEIGTGLFSSSQLAQGSYSAWVSVDTSGTEGARIFGMYAVCDLVWQGTYFNMYMYNGGTYQAASTTNPANGVWYLVTGTWDGTNVNMYVNGELQGSQACAVGPNIDGYKSRKFAIGAGWALGDNFKGAIDDARLYFRALSPAEITAIYNSGSGTEDEFGGFIQVTTNATMTVTNKVLSFIPASASPSSLINVGTNIVVSSNVVLSVSRDGGTTWTDSSSVTIQDTWAVSNVLAMATLALTNQPTGSNVLAKITLTNGCPLVTVKGITAPCGQ